MNGTVILRGVRCHNYRQNRLISKLCRSLFIKIIAAPCITQGYICVNPIRQTSLRCTMISHAKRMCSHSYPSDAKQIFLVEKDRYDCVLLNLGEPEHQCADEHFYQILKASVHSWRESGIRTVTVKVPSKLSYHIPQIIKLGFDFHHAKSEYVLMQQWLSKTGKNNFPSYANHSVGVSGFVVNDEGKVLAIKERFADRPLWKLPGGQADTGEELAVTAQREVFEETGIHCEFVGVLACRHSHHFRYGNSDLYYACLMKATSTDIDKCTQEVLDARWLSLEEYSAELHPLNQFILNTYLEYKKTGRLMVEHKVRNAYNNNTYSVYSTDKL